MVSPAWLEHATCGLGNYCPEHTNCDQRTSCDEGVEAHAGQHAEKFGCQERTLHDMHDQELATVINNWARVPKHVKTAILALVRGGAGEDPLESR